MHCPFVFAFPENANVSAHYAEMKWSADQLCSSLRVCRSQTLTVLSSPPAMNSLPVGSKATARIGSVCAASARSSGAPVLRQATALDGWYSSRQHLQHALPDNGR